MKQRSLPEKYQHTINTFNSVADQYLTYFKDFKLYQKSYDWLLQSLKENHVTVLDIACGPGHVDYYLLQSRPDLQITGIDLAPRMIELARQLNPEGNYQLLDGRNIASLHSKYDVIVSAFCLPYLSHNDMTSLLKNMTEMVHDNGIIYLSTTSSDEPNGYHYSKSATGKTYVYYHDIEYIKSLLQAEGCSLLRHEQIVHIHNNRETHDEFILAQKTT